MLQRVKQFLDDFRAIRLDLDALTPKLKTETALLRHLLGSIDLKDLKPIELLKEGERKEFVASLAVAYPKIERVINQLIDEQKDAGYTLDGDSMFVKGTMNGLFLALEKFQTLHGEHLENTAPKEQFDHFATLPELLERYSRPVGLPSNTQGEKVD
jgi:hypothetical protein